MLGLKQVGTGMLETGRGSGGTAREWAGRSKVGYGLWNSGLWVVPGGLVQVSPRVKMRRLQ